MENHRISVEITEISFFEFEVPFRSELANFGEISFPANGGIREKKREGKPWRELSYDIEDSLDEFLLHATDRSAEPDGFMEKVRSLGRGPRVAIR